MRTCAIFIGLLFFVYDLDQLSMFAFRNVMTPTPPPPIPKGHNDVSRSKNRYVTLPLDYFLYTYVNSVFLAA